MAYTISVDTGGTFTDVIVSDKSGNDDHRQSADDPGAHLSRHA